MWYWLSRMLKNGRGGWNDPRARATRGLRRMRGSRQTVLLARRAPTIKRWSLDARSEEQSAYSLWGSWGIRRSSSHARTWDHPTHPLVIVSMWPCLGQGASLGEEAVLADSGWAGETSGLFEHPARSCPVAPDTQTIGFPPDWYCFSAAY